jgi:uncharacterized membrane protein YtjA (UPF0391 family)
MLHWALFFLIISLCSAVGGFTGLGGSLSWLFQIGFVVFLTLFLAAALAVARQPPE